MSITGNLHPSGPLQPFWDEILRLDQKSFPRPWKDQDWNLLDYKHHTLVCWEKSGEFLGFALLATVPKDEVAHLLKICLEPKRQGSGEALSFWKELEALLKKRGVNSVFLEVEASNLRAQSFYKKAGFQTLRRVKGYYSDGTDGLMMQRII